MINNAINIRIYDKFKNQIIILFNYYKALLNSLFIKMY
jgi:hypothetical protein